MRSAAVYLLMVGVPLLALLAILRAGERIMPPRSVGGEWQVADATAGSVLGGCFAADDGPIGLSVSQSGTRAELTLHQGDRRLLLSAAVAGDSMTARASGDAAAPGCRDFALATSIERDSVAPRLSGVLAAGRCPDCRAESFVATRRPAARVVR